MSVLWQRVRGWRGSMPGGSVGTRLAVMAMIDAVGTGAFLAVSVPFITRSVHLSEGNLGFGLALSAAIALATAIPIGILADRIGPKKVLVGVSLWRCACFVVYPLVQNLWQFLAVVCLLGLVDKAAAPMEQALVGQATATDDRVRVVAILRSLRNVGFTLGALLGGIGLLIDTRAGYTAILLVNAASFAVLASLAARLPVLNASAKSLRRRFSVSVLRDGSFLSFTGINAVLTMHMTLLSIGIPLWIVGHTDVSSALISPWWRSTPCSRSPCRCGPAGGPTPSPAPHGPWYGPASPSRPAACCSSRRRSCRSSWPSACCCWPWSR